MTLAQKDVVNEYFVKTEGWPFWRNTVCKIVPETSIAVLQTELNTVVAKINELVQRKNTLVAQIARAKELVAQPHERTLVAQIARAKEPVAQPHEPETDEHRQNRWMLVNQHRDNHTKVVTVYLKKKNSSNEAS